VINKWGGGSIPTDVNLGLREKNSGTEPLLSRKLSVLNSETNVEYHYVEFLPFYSPEALDHLEDLHLGRQRTTIMHYGEPQEMGLKNGSDCTASD